MRKILILSIFSFIFAALSAQEPACLPKYPEFGYISTLQVSEDEYGIAKDYDYITIAVTSNQVRLHSDQWEDTQTINEWILESVRKNKNGNWIYKWRGYSPTACAYYEIPAVWFPKEQRWSYGYLTEKLCVGVDYTTYRNNTPIMHNNLFYVQDTTSSTSPARKSGQSGNMDYIRSLQKRISN